MESRTSFFSMSFDERRLRGSAGELLVAMLLAANHQAFRWLALRGARNRVLLEGQYIPLPDFQLFRAGQRLEYVECKVRANVDSFLNNGDVLSGSRRAVTELGASVTVLVLFTQYDSILAFHLSPHCERLGIVQSPGLGSVYQRLLTFLRNVRIS